MLIAWENRADAAIVAASSEVATLPGSNVQHPHISRKWNTAAGVVSASLTFDMGSAVACGVLAALGTNLTSSGTLRLRASTADPTAVAGDLYDSTTLAAGVKSRVGDAYLSFNAVTARYWRLDLADATLTDCLKVGRIFLGPKWTPETNQDYGWSLAVNDPSRIAKSKGGQSHAEVLPKFRAVQFALNWLTEADMYGNAFSMAVDAGITADVLAINDTATTYRTEQSVYGLLKASEPIVNTHFNIYRQQFSIEQRL